jgi:hypothetical protein
MSGMDCAMSPFSKSIAVKIPRPESGIADSARKKRHSCTALGIELTRLPRRLEPKVVEVVAAEESNPEVEEKSSARTCQRTKKKPPPRAARAVFRNEKEGREILRSRLDIETMFVVVTLGFSSIRYSRLHG